MDYMVEADSTDLAPDATIGPGSVLRGRHIRLAPGVQIGAGVTIEAERIALGHHTRIADHCTLRGLRSPARTVDIGDRSFIGESSAVLVPEFTLGDYVAIHNHLLCNGYEPCIIGHNAWVGQNCVLNSTAPLTIGNNVGVGAYSSIYTHAFHGELLEGCQVATTAPVTIEDDAWLVGGYNVISPGVRVGARSMVLTSAVVSSDVPPGHTVGGTPARDMTDRLRPYRHVSVREKLNLMAGFVDDFVAHAETPARRIENGYLLSPESREDYFVVVVADVRTSELPSGPGIVYAADGGDPAAVEDSVSVFDLTTKRYTKRRTAHEAEIVTFMNGYRARFVPEDRPRVDAGQSAGRVGS